MHIIQDITPVSSEGILPVEAMTTVSPLEATGMMADIDANARATSEAGASTGPVTSADFSGPLLRTEDPATDRSSGRRRGRRRPFEPEPRGADDRSGHPGRLRSGPEPSELRGPSPQGRGGGRGSGPREGGRRQQQVEASLPPESAMPQAPPWTDPRFLAWMEAQRRWEELSRMPSPFGWPMPPSMSPMPGQWPDPYYGRSMPSPDARMPQQERGGPPAGRSGSGSAPPRRNAQPRPPARTETQPKVQDISQVANMIVELVRGIAHHPDEVWVTELEGTSTTMIEVHVTEEDHGRMVGKTGRVASALREVLFAMGGKYQRRYSLQFVTRRSMDGF